MVEYTKINENNVLKTKTIQSVISREKIQRKLDDVNLEISQLNERKTELEAILKAMNT